MLRTLSVLLPLPQELPEFQRQIMAAISEIDPDMLQQVWAEMDYQLDVCRVTKGGHIQHLQVIKKKKYSFSSHL